jgi:hypothetical protein
VLTLLLLGLLGVRRLDFALLLYWNSPYQRSALQFDRVALISHTFFSKRSHRVPLAYSRPTATPDERWGLTCNRRLRLDDPVCNPSANHNESTALDALLTGQLVRLGHWSQYPPGDLTALSIGVAHKLAIGAFLRYPPLPIAGRDSL